MVEERSEMRRLLGQRAVVIGAGIGGLSAAGALAGFFEQVHVLERDRLPASVAPRCGTPQDRHPHALLAGGLRALDEIFPGFQRDLAEAGAVPVRIAQDFQYERPDVGVVPARELGLSILCASRPLIESMVRRRVEAIPNVVVRQEHRATEIVPAKTAASAPAVRFDTKSVRSETMTADLVIDASGRGAPTLALLDALGWSRPEITEVVLEISYATAVLEVPAQAPDWKVVLTLPNPPALRTSAVLVPLEGDRWMVSIANRGSAARLETWDAFLEALGRLTTPTLHNALRSCSPPRAILHYRFPASLWQHFERLPRLPRGVLPIADALCRFNPVYGQGMAVAAKQARLLQDALSRAAAAADPVPASQTGFMAVIPEMLQTPWSMSTSADFAFPETRGQRPEKFEEGRQFEAALYRAVVADPTVHRAVSEVGQLLQPSSRLREPDILRRIEAVCAKAAA
jgi:2-polyprenyl-6-methoxyphenol hydroxylase-like FAD-dependent oxidoreductase